MRFTPTTLMPARADGIVLAALATMAFVGCGSQGPKTSPVRGTVLLDGQPLSQADISFSPKSPNRFAAIGKTDDAGAFTLSTFIGKPFSGAESGDYVVVVRKVDEGTAPPPPNTDDPNYGKETQGSGNPAKYKPPTLVTPEIYGDKASSPLSASVKTGENEFTFELSSKK